MALRTLCAKYAYAYAYKITHTCAGTWRTAGKTASWCGVFRGSLHGTRYTARVVIKFNAYKIILDIRHYNW